MISMYWRFRTVLVLARLRKSLGIPMRGWWSQIALSYVWTGRVPKKDNWKLHLDVS